MTIDPKVKFFVLSGGKLPERKSEGAAAYDIFVRAIVSRHEMDPDKPHLRKQLFNFSDNQAYKLQPGELVFIGAGFVTEMPPSLFYTTENRSGHASKKILIYSSKVTDSDYRGEAIVPICNAGTEPFEITGGMRIAQIVFRETIFPKIELVENYKDLSQTARGGGGFGSTGAK